MVRVAKVMYMMEPSRLNEYPSGSTKLTILFLKPNFSRDSISIGIADSLLAVLKARSVGSFTALSSLKNGTFITRQTKKRNTKMKTSNPPKKQAIINKYPYKIEMPFKVMMEVTAPKTASGANFIT